MGLAKLENLGDKESDWKKVSSQVVGLAKQEEINKTAES